MIVPVSLVFSTSPLLTNILQRPYARIRWRLARLMPGSFSRMLLLSAMLLLDLSNPARVRNLIRVQRTQKGMVFSILLMDESTSMLSNRSHPGILLHYGRIQHVETAKELCLDIGQPFLELQPSKGFDYTLRDFNGLIAFPFSHPVFNNFIKDVHTNKTQEAIDPVGEFTFEDAVNSVTNIKSREQVHS